MKKDPNKTKKQRIQELEKLRQRASDSKKTQFHKRKKATGKESQKEKRKLQERVKELRCLYGISKLVEQESSLDEIFQETCRLIQKSWQYPEITCARISIGRNEYQTDNFKKTPWKQKAEIKVHRKKAGTVEVGYLKKKPSLDEGPFLKEERDLIEAVAERLGRITERHRAEERVWHLNSVLQGIRNINQLITHERNRKKLIRKSCDYLTEARGYHNAWIALLDRSQTLEISAEKGLGKSFSRLAEKMKKGDLPACGQKAIDKKDLFITENPSKNCPQCPLSQKYQEGTGAAVPLRYKNKMYGLMGICLPQRYAALKEDQDLIKEVGMDLSLALYSIEEENWRTEAEKKLKESEKKFREIFNKASDAMYLHKLKEDGMPGKFIEVNDVACRMLGYTKDEFMTLSPLDIDDPETVEKVPEIMKELRDQKHITFEMNHVAKDGSRVPVEIGSHLFTLNQEPRVLSIARDITERKRSERELREAYHIINHRPAVVFLWRNQEGWPVEYVSDNVIELLGYTAEDFQSGKIVFSKVIHPDDMERVVQEVENHSKEKTRKEFSQEYRVITKDGNEKWVDDRTWIRRNSQGEVTHYQGIILDITERKKAEIQIEEGLKEKEVLLREINHRVKNNMQVISSLLNIQAGRVKDKQAKEALKDTRKRVQSMGLVHERLYKSKDLARVDFSKYIEEISTRLLSFHRDKMEKVKIKKEVTNVFLDINKAVPLGLVLNELISNSLEHAFPDERRGEIRIKFHKKDNDYELQISDDGVGLPEHLDFRKTSSMGM